MCANVKQLCTGEAKSAVTSVGLKTVTSSILCVKLEQVQ